MKTIGYCNNCTCTVTAKNIGVTVVAASGVWCNKPNCKKAATRWRNRFLKEHKVMKYETT